MTSNAGSLLKSGKNVLYISAEMSEYAITKRIDANLLDIQMGELSIKLDKTKFKSRLQTLFDKTTGRLVVKQVPTGVFNSNNIHALLQELKLKKNFVPDVLILDYINIFSSSRLPASAMANSYLWIKSICEEMRSIAVINDLCVLSAVQNNRGAIKQTTAVDMTDIGESFGVAMIADICLNIILTPELRVMGKYLIKVIKTRFAENNDFIYTIGVIFNKMRLTNLDESQQEIPLHVRDQLKVQESDKKKKLNNEVNVTKTESRFDFS
jgi:hypothetical protein